MCFIFDSVTDRVTWAGVKSYMLCPLGNKRGKSEKNLHIILCNPKNWVFAYCSCRTANRLQFMASNITFVWASFENGSHTNALLSAHGSPPIEEIWCVYNSNVTEGCSLWANRFCRGEKRGIFFVKYLGRCIFDRRNICAHHSNYFFRNSSNRVNFFYLLGAVVMVYWDILYCDWSCCKVHENQFR